MANPAKQRGTAWETSVTNYLKEHHEPTAHRNVQYGSKDIGDIDGYYLTAVEAKAERTITLPEYVKQANREAVNAGKPFGAAIVKRRNANVKDAYVVRDLATDVRLMNRFRESEEQLEEYVRRYGDIDPEG